MLSAEQTNYAYDEEDFIVIPQGKTSIIKLFNPNAVDQRFNADVNADFEPKLTTTAKWGGTYFKSLDYAKVAAKGTLTLSAIAQYNFAAEGSLEKTFQVWKKRTWTSYSPGPVPVYQEITLSMDAKVSASASAKIKAMAKAVHTEIVEVGATYDGSTWTTYITHKNSDTLTASLDIMGKANAEIRLIPKIEVRFYKVATGSLTVEPFVQSSLTAEKTTDNKDFLNAHPTRLVQLTSFDASLGLEANVAANLGALGHTWEILPSTCVLGTGSCIYKFNEYEIFSIPKLELSKTASTGTTADINLKVTDGIRNPFADPSIEWEVFPSDATLHSGTCTDYGTGITNCTAKLTFAKEEEKFYTVFASGYGKLGEVGRQFKELTLFEECPYGAKTVMWKGSEWERCIRTYKIKYDEAVRYCQDLDLEGHTDWRLPSIEELRSLVICTNDCPTPIICEIGKCHPWACNDGYSDEYRRPTKSEMFDNGFEAGLWSTSPYYHPDFEMRWTVRYYNGSTSGNTIFGEYETANRVKCIR